VVIAPVLTGRAAIVRVSTGRVAVGPVSADRADAPVAAMAAVTAAVDGTGKTVLRSHNKKARLRARFACERPLFKTGNRRQRIIARLVSP